MEKGNQIQKAITIYVPGNLCNLRCSYCYVSQCLMLNHEEKPVFQYSVEHMVKAFRPERIGGIAYFTVIGGGETLLPLEVVPFVKGLLHQGHVVEVVTNNTLDERIDELLNMPVEDCARLIVKCSLHWNELVRINKVDSYFANIRKIVAAGASSYPFMVICDEYMDKLDEICTTCEREIGVLPQCTPCVVAESREDFLRGGAAVTKPACTPEFVTKIDERMHSKLFKESVRFLNIDPQKVFCYAGKWAFGVWMDSGTVLKCHDIRTNYNFFDNIDEPFEGEYVGCECGVATCGLQYPLFGLGMIPEISNVPTYTEMVCDREGLFQEEVKSLMDTKICEGKHILTDAEQIDFLMNKICEKNKQLAEMEKEKKKAKGGIINAEMVKKLLALVDANKMSYADLKDITYEYFQSVYAVCCTMGNGEMVYKSILEKIYKGLLESHAYDDVDVLYDSEKAYLISKGLLEMPITVMVTCEEYFEVMQESLRKRDWREVAQIYYDQTKLW